MTTHLVPHTTSALSAKQTYRIKRPFWSWLGRRFHVYDMGGALVAYVHHPVLRLREEIVIYSDEAQTRPLAKVKARHFVAIHPVFDVTDPATGAHLGSLRQRSFKSILRDTWEILGPGDQPEGVVEEIGFSILRRFFPILLGRWRIEHEGREVGQIQQIFRFFIKEYVLDMNAGSGRFDPRFGIVCALFALMAESRREG